MTVSGDLLRGVPATQRKFVYRLARTGGDAGGRQPRDLHNAHVRSAQVPAPRPVTGLAGVASSNIASRTSPGLNRAE